jgi:apolipoprotein N-acyltransferase
LLSKFLNPRSKSLVRASLLVLLSLGVATLMSHAPRLRANAWITLPLLVSFAGTADTVRCIQRRWSFYHAGVILCIYMDLMAMAMIAFLLLYPYFA